LPRQFDRRRAALRALLAGANRAPGMVDPTNALFPFARFDQLHVARVVILYDETLDDLAVYGTSFPDAWTYINRLRCRSRFRPMPEESGRCRGLSSYSRPSFCPAWRATRLVAAELGDVGANAPGNWRWGGNGEDRLAGHAPNSQRCRRGLLQQSRQQRRVSARIPQRVGQYTDRPLLPAGAAGALSPAEDQTGLRDLGRNSTYLVLRELHQDVRGFCQFAAARAGQNGAQSLAEAMVGRHCPSGDPLIPP